MIPVDSFVKEAQPEPAPEPRYPSVIATGLALSVIGWAGLFWIVINTFPTIPNRWLFFAFLQLALTGAALPFVRYLHQRFAARADTANNMVVIVRQSVWVGLFGAICLWLRIPRLLSIPLALIILAALVIIEFLFRLRERAQWRPE